MLLFAPYLYISLIDPIALIGRLQVWSAALVQLRCICLHPTPNAAGVHLNTPFGHHFADVLIGERVAEIPAHAQNDHFSRILAPFERIARVDRHRLSTLSGPLLRSSQRNPPVSR